MKCIYVGGGKGGTGKTSTAHLLCLGAILRGEPAAYVLTDPQRKVRGEGRPYGVLDGRLPANLANILSTSRSTLNGWLVIDGGGNRPDFDQAISAEVDACVLPFRASEEDLDTVAQDLQRLPRAAAWPAAWPTNAFAQNAASYFIEALNKAFPDRVIMTPIPFVNSVAELLGATLASPSSPVRQTARKVFDVLTDHLQQSAVATAEAQAA